MVRRIGRWVGISVVVAAALGGLTSCRPPSSTFTAVQLTDPDAVPGDGACRTTSGACSVQAAIEEANALGGATILLAPGLYDVSGLDATIRADLTIRPAAATGPAYLASTQLTVGASGRLRLERVQPDYDGDGLAVIVSGELTTEQTILSSIKVNKAGRAVMTRSRVRSHPDFPTQWPLSATNGGTLLLRYSLIEAPMATGPGGTTYTMATIVYDCTGRPLASRGYNIGPAPACGLTRRTDRDATTAGFGYGYLEGAISYDVDEFGPLADAIPDGVAGCGPTAPDALSPPIVAYDDGDDDAIVGCEIGPEQLSG